jgi:hypothetical protein
MAYLYFFTKNEVATKTQKKMPCIFLLLCGKNFAAKQQEIILYYGN